VSSQGQCCGARECLVLGYSEVFDGHFPGSLGRIRSLGSFGEIWLNSDAAGSAGHDTGVEGRGRISIACESRILFSAAILKSKIIRRGVPLLRGSPSDLPATEWLAPNGGTLVP
jgi:hypothetical protein